MENNKVLLGVLCALLVISLIVGFATLTKDSLDQDTVDASIKAALENLSIPSAEDIASLVIIPEVTIPTVENADNVLLNEFLESQFADNYTEIESNATEVALSELSEKKFRVVERHLKTLLAEGFILEYFEVDETEIETEVKVTKLGLGEDEDKCATVSFELDVYYEFRDEFGFKDEADRFLEVEYSICFTEGEFDDEEVSFVFK